MSEIGRISSMTGLNTERGQMGSLWRSICIQKDREKSKYIYTQEGGDQEIPPLIVLPKRKIVFKAYSRKPPPF